jgi:hypothetical protein
MTQAVCGQAARKPVFNDIEDGNPLALLRARVRMKSLFLKIALPVAMLAAGAMAQEPHDAATHDTSKMGGECGMMMSHMNGMMEGHGDAAKIVDQLQKNVAAMQAEKKSGAMKEKLAAQAALLKDLQARLDGQSPMMMSGCCDTPKK